MHSLVIHIFVTTGSTDVTVDVDGLGLLILFILNKFFAPAK